MSWNHHTHSTQRSLAAIGPEGPVSPPGVQDSLPQTPSEAGESPKHLWVTDGTLGSRAGLLLAQLVRGGWSSALGS